MHQDRFARLHAEHRDVLRAAAMRWCRGDRAITDDLLQDVYERAWRSFASLADPSRALPWLVTILRNCWISRCRKGARDVPVAELPDLPAARDELPPWQRVTIDDVHRAIERLDEPYRSVALMHGVDHLSHADIAGRLSIPYATVATRLHRARKHLRELLQVRFDMLSR